MPTLVDLSTPADPARVLLITGSRWRVKALTYRISSYPKNMKSADVDKELANAFKVWSDYTDLVFTAKKSGQVSTVTHKPSIFPCHADAF